MQDWVIRDAEVLTADGTFVRADVAVAGGRIAGVGGIGRHGHFEEVVVALLDALRRDEAGDFHEWRGDGRLGFGPVGPTCL